MQFVLVCGTINPMSETHTPAERRFTVDQRVVAYESGETGTVQSCQTDPITGTHFYRVALDSEVWWTFAEKQLTPLHRYTVGLAAASGIEGLIEVEAADWAGARNAGCKAYALALGRAVMRDEVYVFGLSPVGVSS